MIDRSAYATPSALVFARKGWTRPLWQQIRRGRGNVHEQDDNGDTLLNWAAAQGNESCVRALLAQGADVNATDKFGRTPLHWAAWRGHAACVCVLLHFKANVRATDIYERTALDNAIHSKHQAVYELLRAAMKK